jgi:hypothetical protein
MPPIPAFSGARQTAGVPIAGVSSGIDGHSSAAALCVGKADGTGAGITPVAEGQGHAGRLVPHRAAVLRVRFRKGAGRDIGHGTDVPGF